MKFIKLDRLIRQQMRANNVPGLAVSATLDGEMVYSRGFGCRNLKRQDPVNVDTLMGIGSITKSFTAFAVMILQDRGLLTIEDSASDHLDYTFFRERPEIKIKHMLSHSSGVPSLDACMLGFTYTFGNFSTLYPASSREDFMAHLAEAEDFILYEPGETFFYNNDMYSCLGFIVESVSGMSFDTFVRAEILEPLEMKRAVMTREAFEADSNIMTGYRFIKENGNRAAVESRVPIGGYLQAPGGIYASMTEMMNYAECLLNGGVFKGKRLLSEASIELLFTGQAAVPYGRGESPYYALGWSIEHSDEVPHRVIHHSGSMETSTSFMMLVPDLKLAVVAAENGNSCVSRSVCRSFVQLALGRDPEESLEDILIPAATKDISGTYRSAYGLYQFSVGLQGAVLQADLETDDGGFSLPLVLENLKTLSFRAGSLRPGSSPVVQFIRDKSTGKVTHVRYDRYLYARV